jgi:hypothetical protein
MRTKIYALGLACILLISCCKKGGSPAGPTDPQSLDPIISYFTATPSTINLGEKSTLSWKVDNCTSVEIDVGIGKVEARGSIEVSPSETTTYTLRAYYQEYNYEAHGYIGGGAEKLCTVVVEN